jgi:transposase InsO family protein
MRRPRSGRRLTTRLWAGIGVANTECAVPTAFGGLRLASRLRRSGNCWDNAAMERFFSSLKTERRARTTYRTRNQAKPMCSITSSAFIILAGGTLR